MAEERELQMVCAVGDGRSRCTGLCSVLKRVDGISLQANGTSCGRCSVKQRHRQTDGETETERDRHRQRQTDGDRDRERQAQTETDRVISLQLTDNVHRSSTTHCHPTSNHPCLYPYSVNVFEHSFFVSLILT